MTRLTGLRTEGEWVRARPCVRSFHPYHDDEFAPDFYGVGQMHTLSENHDSISEWPPMVIFLPDGTELTFRPGTRIGFRWEQD